MLQGRRGGARGGQPAGEPEIAVTEVVAALHLEPKSHGDFEGAGWAKGEES